MSKREDGRLDDELRPVVITRGFTSHPAGSVVIEFGQTKVMCTASVTEGVPRWRKGSGLGWLTAEYAMLPSATHTRGDRESVKGRLSGRTQEISRLVGRSLRACIDLAALGENTIAIDCDVLQADGGTRTAAITGAYVALADAVTYLSAAGKLSDPRPLSCAIAAVSVGVVDGRVRVDLPYEEDARAEVDMNVVATDTGTLVEVQGTAEGATFPRSTLDKLLDAAQGACEKLFRGAAGGVGFAVSGCVAGRVCSAEGVRKLTRLLVASRNRKKLAELRRVLDAAALTGLTLVSLDDVPPFDEAPETGATFEDNALAKARDGFAATGLPTVADDSGLEVAALNGMPGVLSARWSGVHGDDAGNTALLLAQLRDVPDERRGCGVRVGVCAGVGVGSQLSSAASGPAPSRESRAATRASATTRYSFRTVSIAPQHS